MKAELRRRLYRWHRFMEYERLAVGAISLMDDFIAKSRDIGADTHIYERIKTDAQVFIKQLPAVSGKMVKSPLSRWKRHKRAKGKLTYDGFRCVVSICFSSMYFTAQRLHTRTTMPDSAIRAKV